MKDGGFRIVLYCPDTNLKLDGDIYRTRGLGGGKTALIKLVKAFSRHGCDVVFYAFTDGGTYDGVLYRGYETFEGCDTDIFIAFTGHKLDLSGLRGKRIEARLKVLLVGGAWTINNVDATEFDFYYAISHYLKERLITEWGLPYEKVIAVEHGYDPDDIGPAGGDSERDSHKIIFASHPGKGLQRVEEIVRKLREHDSRFQLDVYGSRRLWDDQTTEETSLPPEPWVSQKGLIGQPELIRRMQGCGFMLHLTDYPDLQSLVIQQAKKAGVITIASDVGGNSELIEDGHDGFLVEDHFLSDVCLQKVVALVTYVVNDAEYAGFIRENARRHCLTWDGIAVDWIGHWNGLLGRKKSRQVVISGYYGFRNLGDEAILDGLIEDLRSVDPDAGISVVSGDPFYTEKIHRVRAIPADNLPLQVKEVERADVVVLGGGGLFQDHHRISVSGFFMDHRFGVASYANLPLMGKIYEKPVMYVAHGVGPLFSTEACLFSKWAFGLADYISVRDEYSYRMLVDQLGIDREKVVKSCDRVCAGLTLNKERTDHLFIMNGIPRGKKIVCVSLRRWLNESDEKRAVVNTAGAISSFSKEHPEYHFVFIPFQLIEGTENDLVMIGKVAERLSAPYSILKRYGRAGEIIALYREAEFSIGMRYHSLVFSALAGTPMIGLIYDEKNEELMGELGLDLFSLPLKDFEGRDMLDMMNRLAGSSEAEMDALKEKVKTGLANMAGRGVNDKKGLRTFLNGE